MQPPLIEKNNRLSAYMKTILSLSLLFVAFLASFTAFYWFKIFAAPFVVAGWALLYRRPASFIFVVTFLTLAALGIIEFINLFNNFDLSDGDVNYNAVRNSWKALVIVLILTGIFIFKAVRSSIIESKINLNSKA